MKRQTINYSWPATLSFSADNGNETERFSRGKLKVFYKGETADHRYFSDDFSKEVIKSLPYTPIVSYYDEDKDDFVGHATEQAIYGIVDPCGEVSFETDDEGKSWCVCDTIMYTERPDKVGEIAKKIEGHSQSLELDPQTVKYTVNYDNKRHFKNIEFTAGHFVGVSVLGSDQKPAFTGSEFFSCDEQFAEKMKILKEYCERKGQETQSGGTDMDFREFITLSWGDKATKVEEALNAAYSNEYGFYIIDMFDDSAVGRFYSYIDDSIKLLRIMYSIDENGVVTLGDAKEVHIVYEDIINDVSTSHSLEVSEGVVTEVTSNVENAETTVENTDNCACGEDVHDDDEENHSSTDCTVTSDESVTNDSSTQCTDTSIVTDDAATSSDFTADDAAQMTNAQNTEIEVGAGNEQTQEENSSSASLTDSERAEFETLKREKKETLINSYKDILSEDEYNGFFATIDTLSFEEIETDLLKIYKRHSEESANNAKIGRAFSLASLLNRNEKQESSLVSSIKHYLGRE